MTDDRSRHLPSDLGAAGAASLLADLVDVLLPGGDGWPPGAAAGVQAVLAARLDRDAGGPGPDGVIEGLLAAGAPFAGHDEAARVAIVAAFERSAPQLFGFVRDAAFMAYYESPFVAAAINAKGFPYALRPHVHGYALARFDAARDTPRHGRGSYVATGAVLRLDIAALDLDSGRTTAWGLAR